MSTISESVTQPPLLVYLVGEYKRSVAIGSFADIQECSSTPDIPVRPGSDYWLKCTFFQRENPSSHQDVFVGACTRHYMGRHVLCVDATQATKMAKHVHEATYQHPGVSRKAEV